MMIKVALIDESAIFRTGLKKCLTDSNSNIEVIGEAADGLSGQHLIRQKHPDIVLLSTDLPDGMTIAVCDFTATHFPKLPVVCLVYSNNFNFLSRLIHSSVKGFLAKDSVYSIGEAIKTVYSGKTYLQPDMGLIWLSLHQKQSVQAAHSLTDREYQILILLCRGKTSEDIAAIIHVSVRTVFNLKSSGMKKLGVQNLEQLRLIM